MPPDGFRILLLCYEYPPLGGGGGVGAKQYAEAWANKGCPVTVLTGGGRGLPGRDSVGGVEVIRVAGLGKQQRATSTFLSMFAYLLGGAWFLARHRGEFRQVKIINTHFSIPTGPLGWTASVLLRRPNVLTIVGGDIFDPTKPSSPHRHLPLRTINRFLMRTADRVIAISSDTRRRAEQHYQVGRAIDVIPYGFQPPPPTPPPPKLPSSERYRLIAVGRLVPRKGFIHLIRALALLPPDVELVLIGDGPEEGVLKQAARTAGVDRRITWLGYQPREAIHQHLCQADCFVLSSLHEGLGIVVQEAMFAGLPIIATDEGGQVDLIHEDRNGLLVKPGAAEPLATAIYRLYKNRALASAMSRNNREDIGQFLIANNCETYLNVFRQLLNLPVPASGNGEKPFADSRV